MKKIYYFTFSLFSISIQSNAQCRVKACGGNAPTLALKNDGALWAWGGNFYSQQGDETNTMQNHF